LGVSLEAIEPNVANIERLLEAAQASLNDARLPNLSCEGRFDMAYKAIMLRPGRNNELDRLIRVLNHT
jgi:hypothetical protein